MSVKPGEARYRLVPQMRVYDRIPRVLAPYLTTNARPRFRSDVVNTDGLGYRISYREDEVLDTETWWEAGNNRGIVVGGSNVFGIGATHDRHTLVSALNSLTGFSFLNLGIRAGNSTQELIATIPFLADSKYVLVCSGVNNLLVSLQSTGTNALYGPMFAEEVMEVLATYTIHELRQLVDSSLRGVRLRTLIAEILRRVHGRMTRSRFRKPSSVARPPARGQSAPDVRAIAARESLARQKRDLVMIARSLPDHACLIFLSQPFAAASSRKLSREEQQLFDLADAMQGRHWQIMKSTLVDLWSSYVDELQRVCADEGIVFVDLNSVEYKGWSYVDRVHMTDNGYRQIAERIAEKM